MSDHALIAETALACCLTGLIWTIQLVHYPLFGRVGERGFETYHAEHGRRITWIVAVLMPAELLLAGLGVFVPAEAGPAAWVGFAAVVAIWLVTALVQVPQHARLGRGPDPALLRALVRWNWPRTLLWTLRAALLCGRLAEAGP